MGVDVGCTVTLSVGGLGSLTPLLSTAVNDTLYAPGLENVIDTGLGTALESGVPSSKTHE